MNLVAELACPAVGDATALFDVVERCGLRGVALKVRTEQPAGELPLEQLAKCGLGLKAGNGVVFPGGGGPRLAAFDVGDDWHRHGQAWLDCAANHGANHLVLDAGSADEERRPRRLAALRELADAAAKRGMTVCLDTLPGLCENSRAMAKALREIDHGAVRLCFDLGGYLWLNPEANAEIALQRLLGSISMVRLRDFGGRAASPRFPPPGNGGAIDFVLVLQVLRSSGFNGPCIVSFDSVGRAATARVRPGDNSIEAFALGLAGSVKHLRDCGWFDEI